MNKVYVKVKDSLGNIVTEYSTQILKCDYDSLIQNAEECDNGLVAFKDCEVDGELGWKEYYLSAK